MSDDENAPKLSRGGNTAPPTTRSKSWCFTSFEKDPPIFNSKYMKYLVYGKEIAPTTKRLHWQSFVHFIDKCSMKRCKKYLLSNAIHIEAMRGTIEQAIDYCKKDGDWKEFGEVPVQGKRTDVQKIILDIVSGKTTRDDVILTNGKMFNQFRNTLKDAEDIKFKRNVRTEMTQGIWIYGKTGCGKSHHAFELAKGKSTFILKDDHGWWDDYAQEEIVIINEFRGTIKYGELLTLVDKWPEKVRRRGRAPINFTSKLVIITSSMHPKNVYKNIDAEDNIDQLLRRFKLIKLNKKI